MSDKVLLLALSFAAATAACSNAGFSEATRKDISGRMASVQQPINRCYEAALSRNRKAAGTIVVAFVAEEKTGRFKDVAYKRNDIADGELDRCISAQVVTLKLQTPTTANVAVEYPLDFAWVD